MQPNVREEIETAVQAVDQAIAGLLAFAATLKPVLRNEILQICGPHLERARAARDRLAALLQTGEG
jgi:hypothetical protein